MNKPVAPACERNKAPILAVLEGELPAAGCVLEIGSGTGQHAVHFAAALPGLTWITSDVEANHAGIRTWLDEAALANVMGPLALDVSRRWPSLPEIDAVFTANTLHIMHWPEVVATFEGVGQRLAVGSKFLCYGPFAFHGAHTAASNAAFDESLKHNDPGMGIRDIDDLTALAGTVRLSLDTDYPMPANNRILVWRKD